MICEKQYSNAVKIIQVHVHELFQMRKNATLASTIVRKYLEIEKIIKSFADFFSCEDANFDYDKFKRDCSSGKEVY